MSKISKIIIIPGNGCVPIHKCNWYAAAQKHLQDELKGIEVVMKDFPDPYVARKSIWTPFVEKLIGNADDYEKTVLIGHSSGAEFVMRWCETHKIAGAVVVSPCVTDLGDSNERASGYYSDPWLWDQMRQNCAWFQVWTSKKDHLIPWKEEQKVVVDSLVTRDSIDEHHCSDDPDMGHFLVDQFPEMVSELVRKIKQIEAASASESQQS